MPKDCCDHSRISTAEGEKKGKQDKITAAMKVLAYGAETNPLYSTDLSQSLQLSLAFAFAYTHS